MAGLIRSLWATLIRVLLLLFGLAMFFGVMVFGVLAAIGITVWALLTGRRVVPLDFGWKGPVDWRSRGRRRSPERASTEDVVDIEAREIGNDAPTPPERKDQPPV